MASPDRGTKRQCQHCSTKFYDLNRDPILCPSCSKEFLLEDATPAPEPEEEKEVVEEVETDTAAKAAGAEVISINDVEGNDDDDDDDNDDNGETIPDVDDVEVDDALGGGDSKDTFLESDDDDNNNLGIDVSTSNDDS